MASWGHFKLHESCNGGCLTKLLIEDAAALPTSPEVATSADRALPAHGLALEEAVFVRAVSES